MNRKVLRITMSALVVGICCSIAIGETLDDVSKKIIETSKKIKSFSAKSRTVTKMSQQGFSMTATMVGTSEMLRKGDEYLFRNEMKGTTENVIAGNTTRQESTTLVISDGKYTYTLTEAAGMKQAFKTKSEKTELDPLKMWRENGTLKLLPDTSINGEKVWVIEVTPKQTMPGQGKTVMYFSQKHGQMVKTVVFSDKGEPMTTVEITEIQIDAKIDPSRFVFNAPPGVQVTEM